MLEIEFCVNLAEMVTLNFDKQISKIRSLLQQWSRRLLTPIGRITVLKTIIIPKMNHLFISLPDPSNEFINRLNDMFYKFIWNNKIDKVKRTAITRDYLKGGLKMINIGQFIKALKCTWIRRLVNSTKSSSWISVFQTTYGQNAQTYFFELGDDYLNTLTITNNNIFWKDVFNSWKSTIKYIQPNRHNLLYLPLWLNSNIKIGSRSVIYKDWYKKGVKNIGDLMDSNNTFLNKTDFEDKFDIYNISFLKYHGMISSVSKYINMLYLENIKSYTQPYIPEVAKVLYKNKKGCKDFYDLLATDTSSLKHEMKWQEKLKDVDINWSYVYRNCFKTIQDTRIQWFQYQILYRILPVKKYLKTVGIIQDDSCSFCQSESEAIEHILFYCHKSRELWTQLSSFIFHKINKHIQFDIRNVMFGVFDSSSLPINVIILVTKTYLHLCARRNERIHILALKNILQKQFELESYIAKKNLQTANFDKKWGVWINLFD